MFENDLLSKASKHMVKPFNVTDGNESSLYPSGGHLMNHTKEIHVQEHEAGETQVLLHDTQSKNYKDLLEYLDENVIKLMEAKTTEDQSVASSHLCDADAWDLSQNVQDIYNTFEVSDEHIPLIQSCIQEVVTVKNYFDKGKHKSKHIKPI
ncbi:uncharacterized protein LOC134248664 [Saccostrea cucullata]|uniref:uncharacterized protein LOC134248664 n=1 Tax=Saccostrea cuccullata TaxID=36930 RepID=UPI002ED1178D